MQATHRSKARTLDNIEFLINIGEFKLMLSLPKSTTVHGLIAIVKGYEVLHEQHGPTNCHYIGLGALHNNPFLDYWLSQSQLDFLRYRKRLQLKALYSMQKRSDHITSNQFEYLVCLGKGACGEVYLVRSRITACVFALKRIRKQTITNYNALMTQFRERKNMIKLGNNQHTVNLHATFQSRHHFNFLMDYYPGGQLFLHLTSNQNKLSINHIRHYICQIILAMEFIHRKKVLYRDLKPQNIFVDLNGHLRIGDFGLSKCDFQEEDFAYSVCGSPQYMAPQILQNKDYNFSADIYSIGALLFQFLTGYPPYYGQGDEGEKLLLMKCMDLNLQNVTEDVTLRELLVNLLHPDPDKRISNFQQIKNSHWLSSVDWKMIESKSQIMPFAPDPNGTYIVKEFLNLQKQVDEMNYHYEDDNFTSDIADAFQYIRPQSKKLLGMDEEFPQLKPIKQKLQPIQRVDKKQMLKKANLSVALFQREENNTQTCSTSQIKTTKNANKQNLKQNKQARDNFLLRRDISKKNLSKQPSQLLLLGKNMANVSQINLLKGQKSQRIILTASSNNSQNSSQCSSKNLSKGKDSVRIRISDIRDGKSKCKSKQKSMKETSLPKNGMLKKKDEKKTILPTCSYKIKLT